MAACLGAMWVSFAYELAGGPCEDLAELADAYAAHNGGISWLIRNTEVGRWIMCAEPVLADGQKACAAGWYQDRLRVQLPLIVSMIAPFCAPLLIILFCESSVPATVKRMDARYKWDDRRARLDRLLLRAQTNLNLERRLHHLHLHAARQHLPYELGTLVAAYATYGRL